MIEKRNELYSIQLIKSLKSRNIEGFFVKTKEEALTKALELIPRGSKVGWGGSVSIDEIGLKQAIKSGDYVPLDREIANSPQEASDTMHEILRSCDYFITSTNALSEDGILVNIDGNSNRIAAMCYGPKHLLFIVGMNKVVKSSEDALSRARNIAAPINAQKFPLDTPCKKTGACYDCKSPDTICCQILFTRYTRDPNRVKLILVEENLGF